MEKWLIGEIFTSINGEGRKAGQLAVFIRLIGCNLNCSYCDTAWARVPGENGTWMTTEQVMDYVKESKVHNITITGGEPLLTAELDKLLDALYELEHIQVEIETNGAVDIAEMKKRSKSPSMTVDYKLPSSGMEQFMYMPNFQIVDENDTVKFVCGSREDLQRAKQIIEEYQLVGKTAVYFSPVFEKLSGDEIVEFMKQENLNGVNLQLQLHKMIWEPDARENKYIIHIEYE